MMPETKSIPININYNLQILISTCIIGCTYFYLDDFPVCDYDASYWIYILIHTL